MPLGGLQGLAPQPIAWGADKRP